MIITQDDIAAVQELFNDMDSISPKVKEAFLDDKAPNAILLSWLALKGYSVNAEPFAEKWAAEIQHKDTPDQIASLTLDDNFNVALRQGIKDLFLPPPYGKKGT